MQYLLQKLKPYERRGSKARCHLLTHGSVDIVSERLTSLISPWGAVTGEDRWMPRGFKYVEEARFGRQDIILDRADGESLVKWWLAVPGAGRVPQWDIASTCTIGGKRGLLLVEAKAYDKELTGAEAGKRTPALESVDSRSNQRRIELCLGQANSALTRDTKLDFQLSVKHHYQMSSRFAWAWKLTDLGFPVALVYLGFVDAEEMVDRGIPIENEASWEQQVKAHSRSLFPDKLWGQKWLMGRAPLIPLIKTYQMDIG
jgi:hypothetical protein